jgi:outer membrane protein assembly factor BamB
VIDGTLLRSANNNLYALDASSGSIVWTFPTNGSIINAPAVDAQGVIYVTCVNPGFALYAVLPNGTQKWAVPVSQAELAGPVLDASGLVIIGSNGYDVVSAYNASTGALVRTGGACAGACVCVSAISLAHTFRHERMRMPCLAAGMVLHH